MASMGLYFLMYALCCFHKNEGMRVDLTKQNLTDVPGDIDVNVTELDLSENEITNITNNSFVFYNQLIRISLHDNDLIIIEDGSFDHNAKLKYLDMSDNKIQQVPQSFGPATKSLEVVQLWAALDKGAVKKLNLKRMINLRWLNIGNIDHQGMVDPAVLPNKLETVNLNAANVIVFPNFTKFTPNVSHISIGGNHYLTRIPDSSLSGNLALKELNIHDNGLATLPDLYHLPLNKLSLQGNPLICNQSVCWIRMWSWMKTPLTLDTILCEAPESVQGKMLMETHPVASGCQNGKEMQYLPSELSMAPACVTSLYPYNVHFVFVLLWFEPQ